MMLQPRIVEQVKDDMQSPVDPVRRSAGAMEEQGGFHPIACESCRNKKSKCDREVPVCSQCAASSTACRYPPINKRGIPSGYIGFIEQRLLETELVVFELLTTLQQSHSPVEFYRCSKEQREAIVDFSAKQAKSAKIEEWKNMSLGSEEQWQKWWQSRKDIVQKRFPSEQKNKLQGYIHNAPTEPRLESMSTYDPSTTLELLAPSPSQPQSAHLGESLHEVGHILGSFEDVTYPGDTEKSVVSPNVSMSTPRPPDPGSLSETQWRKYF